MVKEEDKGRGCMTGHGIGGVFSMDFSREFQKHGIISVEFKKRMRVFKSHFSTIYQNTD